MSREFRTGIGYDSHRLEIDRRLVLGGIEIPFPKGLAGHSDGDIVLHALTDALLGAAGLGDIGQYFPPTDEQWRDAESTVFLEHARKLLETNGYQIVNVDVVIIIEKPKILPHRDRMRQHVAKTLGIDMERVGLKAKTAEGLGAVGAGEAAEAHAVATIARKGLSV
jgi:2-C-methyl-D-erythritol 2,4-cyclodiphosphate synthase